MQPYWYCSTYLVCLRHLPLELPHRLLIRAALRAGTQGIVLVPGGAARAGDARILEAGAAAAAAAQEGPCRAGVSSVTAGPVVVSPGCSSPSSSAPMRLECPLNPGGLLARSCYHITT